MFERFTDRARRVVVLAQEEARALRHDHIGTEHILLGLIHEGNGVAAKVLESLGLNAAEIRQEIVAATGRGDEAPDRHIPFTAQAKRVLELALREASLLGHGYIGTEHILLGLIRDEDGVAAQVLSGHQVQLAPARQQVVRLLPGYSAERAATGRVPGLGGRPRRADEAMARLQALDLRLEAIELWVGMKPDLPELTEEIGRVRRDKETAIDTQDFPAAAALREQEKDLLAQQEARLKDWAAGPSMAEDVRRLSAELAELRALLRAPGSEPGESGP